jgi:hypothetical protein
MLAEDEGLPGIGQRTRPEIDSHESSLPRVTPLGRYRRPQPDAPILNALHRLTSRPSSPSSQPRAGRQSVSESDTAISSIARVDELLSDSCSGDSR